MSFAGKTAFVTGAAGGMGLQIAHDLLSEGANVAMIDVKPTPDCIPMGDGNFIYINCDLTDDVAVKEAVDQTIEAFGQIDYLANVAGVLWFDRDKSVLEMEMDVWDQVFQINLKSMAHTTRHIAPHMKKTGGGAMVHFSTIQCLRGDDAPQDAYQASKAGVIALSKSLAVQLGPDGIRSNAILPGPVHSPMQARWDDDYKAINSIADIVPLGRIGQVQDMANACLFLLSDKASFITGTEMIVDGGLLARP
jgi:NAD(P)-dependent dehydrogenase (short-subunit alcohol dehydrogenase family)